MCSPKLSAVPRSSARAVAALVAARVLTEGIAFACLLAVAQPIAGGTAAVPVGAAAAAVPGIAVLLVAGLREAARAWRGAGEKTRPYPRHRQISYPAFCLEKKKRPPHGQQPRHD